MGSSRCLYLLLRWIRLHCLLTTSLIHGQSIQWSPYVQSYPVPQIPLGYQPPPTGPVVNEYSSNAFYQQPQPPHARQQLTMLHVRNGHQPQQQQHWTPNQQPQQFQQQQNPKNVEQTQQNWQPKAAPPSEPLIINTLIQVFSHDDPEASVSLAEARAVTAVNHKEQPGMEAVLNGQNRVVLSRQLDTQARTYLPAPTQVAASSRQQESPSLLAVKAFAATNSSKISSAELEMELNKELESSIPTILDELNKVEKAQKQQQKINEAPHATVLPSANQAGEVDTTDLEKLIEEGLATVEQETTITVAPMTTATSMPLIVFSKTSQIFTTSTTTTTIATTIPIVASQEPIPEAEEPNDGREPFDKGEQGAATEPVPVVTDTVKLGQEETQASKSSETTQKSIDPETEFQEDHTAQRPVADKNSEQETGNTQLQIMQETTPTAGQYIAEKTEDEQKPLTSSEEKTTTLQPMESPESTTVQENLSIVEKIISTSQPTVTPEPTKARESFENVQEITTPTTQEPSIEEKTTSRTMPASESPKIQGPPAIETKEEALTTGASFVTEESGMESATQGGDSSPQKSVKWSTQTTAESEVVTSSEGTTVAFSEDSTTVPLVAEVGATTPIAPPLALPTSALPVSDYQEPENSPNMPEITSTSEEPNQEKCSQSPANGDNVKADVLFLLDSSTSVGAEQFQRSLQLIRDTVQHFHAVGPNGIQVSLIQYNREPFLEFTFRRHSCLSDMISDIADTEFMNGVSNLGRAIEKVMKFAFTKPRGDRPEAENVVVLVTDGQSDDEWQTPLEANKTDLMKLADDRKQNLFNLTEVALNIPLAERLAQRIEQVAQQAVTQSPAPPQFTVNELQPSSGEQSDGSSAGSNDQFASEETQLPIEPTSSSPSTTTSLTDPTVSVECLSDGVRAIFHLSSSFKGSILAKDAAENPDCSREIQPFTSDTQQNTKLLEMEIRSPNCGLHLMKSKSPNGQNLSIVLNVIHDKRLVTGVDRSFIIQCFVPVSSDLQNEGELAGEEVETTLKILPGVALSKTIALERTPPKCNYSLRRDSPNGAIIQAAAVGQILFHRWECDGGRDTNTVFGMHVYDCSATNHSSQDGAKSYTIIDKNGCTADPSLLGEVIYAEDRLLAYAKAFVFTLRDVDSLKFSCKIGLCVRNGDGCEGYSPPVCNASNVSEMLLSAKNQRLQDSVINSALTSQVDSPEIAVMSASALGAGVKGARLLGGMSKSHYHSLSSGAIAIFLIGAIVLGSVLGVACFLISRRCVNHPSASLLDEEDGKSSSRPPSVHGEEYFHEDHASPVLVDWSANRITRLGAPPTSGREEDINRLSISTIEGENHGSGVTSEPQRMARLQQQRNDTLNGT